MWILHVTAPSLKKYLCRIKKSIFQLCLLQNGASRGAVTDRAGPSWRTAALSASWLRAHAAKHCCWCCCGSIGTVCVCFPRCFLCFHAVCHECSLAHCDAAKVDLWKGALPSPKPSPVVLMAVRHDTCHHFQWPLSAQAPSSQAQTRRETLFLSHFYTHNLMWAVPWSPERSPDWSSQVHHHPLHCAVWSFHFWWLEAMNPPNFAVFSPWLSIPFKVVCLKSKSQYWHRWCFAVTVLIFPNYGVLAAIRWIKEVPSGSKEKMANSLHDKHSTSCHWLEDCTSKLLNSLLNSLLASLFC